ncbi:MAG TPA: HD domain-containing phosphohydrolase [Phycisphaerae bacterium]|nr:HD domain-containing phosphohydrolase [Phycisphaerae bacterium]
MNASSELVMDPSAGRLPAPSFSRCLSDRQFQRIAHYARARGLWVSLWNDRASLVAEDTEAGPFWGAWRKPLGTGVTSPFVQALEQSVRNLSIDSTTTRSDPDFIPVVFEPAADDFASVAIPIHIRRRRAGFLLAIAATAGSGDEDFVRLCGRCGLDGATMRRLRESAVVHRESVGQWAGMLALAVEQSRELDVVQGELASLSNNLESTYEELHLIYEISRLMGIPQKPTQMLERVSRELLEVSRCAGLAFVLGNGGECELSWPSAEPVKPDQTFEHVVQVGQAAPSCIDVLRLDKCILAAQKLEADHIVINKACDRPEFSWAAAWLRHLVALPLRLDGELLGMLYGINVIDGGDYTSIDIQLLKAVSDRISAALKNQNLYDDLADLLLGLMHALVNSVDAKDPYTYGHSERVAYFSRAIAQAAGLPAIDCERVYLAGLLHDVGKIGVPDAILTKPGKLTTEEFDALKKHPEIGERILSHIRQLRDLLPGVMYHHERMDGRGYPHGLSGKDIPLLGRIICLADSFDAMTSNRTYRAALPIAVAAAEIRRCSGTQFDPALADVLLKIGPKQLFEEAKQNTRGDTDLGRMGALCSVLSGRPGGAPARA